ncbi:hypothetical protein PPEP_b0594 [Pseudoalteromonas peptidolytica F12-50-A1]|uniref:Uncharacterized protein n=1 Tax=Pseudoalteromonas peptidolytica F12-50-A1 TaxID=1315280 RepID=A0A8I0T6S3_9GAMM|nr:hypothetical protein [Pseudoalteromonas peptidolytica F12-50-A1]
MQIYKQTGREIVCGYAPNRNRCLAIIEARTQVNEPAAF